MAGNIDEYLKGVPEEPRVALEKLRQTIRAIVPDAVEGISYGIPTFKHKGRPLVGFGAARNHCSFFVMSSTVLPAFKDRLKSYDTSTGTVRFAAAKPLPATLVKMFIRARIAENEKRKRKK